MNEDIRISVDFLDHHKTMRLKKTLGYQGVESLMRLWFYAAKYRADGHLINMDTEDIIYVSRWNGESEKFINALTLKGKSWLDWKEDHWYLHNWHRRNEYATHAEHRSEIARKAARARWSGKGKQGLNAKGIEEQNAPSPNPSPSPSPNPKEKTSGKEKDLPDDGRVKFFEEHIWKPYPPRNGRKRGKPIALGFFLKKMNPADDENLAKAVKNLAESEDTKQGVGIQDLIRFLRPPDKNTVARWREWVNPELFPDQGRGKSKSKGNVYIESPTPADDKAEQALQAEYAAFLAEKFPLTRDEILAHPKTDRVLAEDSDLWFSRYTRHIREDKATQQGLSFETWRKNT